MKQEEAFLAAFNNYSDALFRHCFFRLSDRERALELVQDTFLKAWDYIRGGGEVRQFRSFLYRILNNLIIDEYRRKSSSSLDELLEREGASEGDYEELYEGSVTDLESKLDDERSLVLVREALKELPPSYRQVITLRFVDGFMSKEISRMIGESENVVSVRINRGLNRLRKQMGYA